MRLIDIFSNYVFAEWVFSIIVIATCFLIYFKTKEFYELSVKHSGIKYFRLIFLYFGFTYIIRLILTLVGFFPDKIFSISTFNFIYAFVVYTSALTFFYLMMMFFWRRLGDTFLANPILIHMISFSFAIISIFQEHPYLFVVFHLGILVALAVMVIETKVNGRKENSFPMMFMLYSLVFGHWILITILQFFADFYEPAGILIYVITFSFLVTLVWKILSHLEDRNGRKRKT